MQRTAAAVAGATLVSVWATWPLGAHLATQVYDPTRHGGIFAGPIAADVRLVLWILAWDVHALATAPTTLWDANIFHPAPHALALSEHLLGALPLYAPLAAVTRDPVLAHQATLLATFVGACLAMGALAWELTGCGPAAALAASLFAFSPFRGGHLGALQIEGCWLLPLVVLAVRRTIETSGYAWPVALAAALAAVALHSVYLAYGAFLGLVPLVAVLLAGDPAARRAWRRLAVPLAVAAGLVGAIALPYLAARAGGVLVDPAAAFVVLTSARPGQTGAGVALAIALATVPWWRRGLAGPRPAWLLALLAAAFASHLVALGTAPGAAGPYALLARIVPGFSALRIPLRFNAFATAMLALLAGIGAAGVLRRLPARAARAGAVAVVLLALAAARHGLPHPVPLAPIETRTTLPPIYAALARAPAGPLLEVPWSDFDRRPAARGIDAERIYRSVYHWRPLLNGYSGYAPPTYAVVSALVEALPDEHALRLLARLTGLRLVLLHWGELDPASRPRWEPAALVGLAPIATAGDDELLALRDPPPADLLPAFVASAPSATTLTGTPLVRLPPEDRRAVVRGRLDAPTSQANRHQLLDLTLEVTNASDRTWPALVIRHPERVVVAARWNHALVGPASDEEVGRVPWDLAPGEHARIPVTVRTPDAPGPWTLVLGVRQGGAWFDGTLSILLDVR